MGSAGTSILVETSTPTRPPTRSGDYTLDREEPHYLEDPATRGGSALAELKKFKGLHAYTKAYDVSAKESFDKALGSLELGDAGPLQRDVTVNCMVE
ncbi:Hypothetical protein PFR_JS14_72 [Propionibacterium freudenreichii]|nr:Hypothetical protein PFR_JS14_72 [Propionibacterium freudenreichii]